jgi:hypothetical protein
VRLHFQESAHHRNKSIFKVEKFLIEAFGASLRPKVHPKSDFWVSRPSPGKTTQEHPRIHAPVRSWKTRETHIVDGSECSSDEEDIDASQDKLPAVEKQGKTERGVLAF